MRARTLLSSSLETKFLWEGSLSCCRGYHANYYGPMKVDKISVSFEAGLAELRARGRQ